MSQQAQQLLPPPRTLPLASWGAIPWAGTWVLLLSISAIVNAFIVSMTHGTRGMFVPVLTTSLCFLAALFDGWTQRIPNQLTYVAIVSGLLLNGAGTMLAAWHWPTAVTWLGAAGIQSAALGFAMCALLGVLGRLIGGVHGGDLKLLAAVGAMAGFEATCSIALVALCVALGYAVINLALLGRLTLMLRIAAQRVLELFYLRRFQTPVPEGSKLTHIPMAIPLAVAVVLVTYLQARLDLAGGKP